MLKRSQYRIALDVRDNHGTSEIAMRQSDTFRRLYFELTDGGTPYPVSDRCCAIFLARKPRGYMIYNRCEIRDGCVVYDLTPQTTSEPGLLNCELRLYDQQVSLEPDETGKLRLPTEDIHLLTSATFWIRVLGTVYDQNVQVQSAAEFDALTRLEAEMLSAVKETRLFLQDLDRGDYHGINATHRWDGTRLIVTSASGTSGADLQGPKGDPGPQGAPGSALIDNEAVRSDAAWSSGRIVERLCPPIQESGTFVQCEPLAGTELTVAAASACQLAVCGKNLYNSGKYPLVEGTIVRYENGIAATGSAIFSGTDYIPVAHLRGKQIAIKHSPVVTEGSTGAGLAFYDAAKAYIKEGSTRNTTTTVPNNATYMRFSINKKYAQEAQIEIGGVSTDYEPYHNYGTIQVSDIGFFTAGEGVNTVYGISESDDAVSLTVTGYGDPAREIEKLKYQLSTVLATFAIRTTEEDLYV